jgi:hypothetical protein
MINANTFLKIIWTIYNVAAFFSEFVFCDKYEYFYACVLQPSKINVLAKMLSVKWIR